MSSIDIRSPVSGLLEPLGLGQEAPAGHSRVPKTAQPLATTSVHDRCAKGPSELLSSSTRERNGDTHYRAQCYVSCYEVQSRSSKKRFIPKNMFCQVSDPLFLLGKCPFLGKTARR